MSSPRNIPHPDTQGFDSSRFKNRLEIDRLKAEVSTMKDFHRAVERNLAAIFDDVEAGKEVALSYPDGRVAIITLKSWRKGAVDNG